MTQGRIRFLFTSLLLLTGLLMPVREARADLTITPVRVVFQNRDRSATVELLNVTNRTNTYRMSWLLMKADKSGRYTLMPATDDKDPHSVANMVIFTPRQVTIEPHGYQIIRLSVRRPADLPFGEYRAHLAMTRLANQGPRKPDIPPKKGQELSMNVNLSFSIPVIVRSGEDNDLKVALDSPWLAAGGGKGAPAPVLNIDLNRVAGKFSSYGVINVFWQPPNGQEKPIGSMSNVALYPELQQRHLAIPLTENPTGGKVRVVYEGKYESEGTTWDDKTFPIGK
jgi:P pilus assembly chaperone PapD